MDTETAKRMLERKRRDEVIQRVEPEEAEAEARRIDTYRSIHNLGS